MAQIIFNLSLILLLIPINVFADSLTLTTYYPAPHGAYDRLRLVPRADIASPCQSGMLYVNSQNQLQFCQDNGQGNGTGAWGPVPGVWTQSTVQGDTSVFVINDSAFQPIYVGIGTSAPSSLLEIRGAYPVATINTTVADGGLRFLENGVNKWELNYEDNSERLNVYDMTISQEIMTFEAGTGMVGIGAPNPASALDVVGNVNVSGDYRIGGNRMISNSGTYNTFLGINTGSVNTGSYNTFVGKDAGEDNSSATNNTFMGAYAGRSVTTGGNNTFIGAWAGEGNTNTSPTNNVVIGGSAGQGITGDSNIIIGSAAVASGGSNSLSGSYNIIMGARAGPTAVGATASRNIAIGGWSGQFLGTTLDNVYIGDYAGNQSASNYNVFIGSGAGQRYVSSSDDNVAIGFNAAIRNSSGSQNVFLGRNAGSRITVGADEAGGLRNVAIGYEAGSRNTGVQGNDNVMIGYRAGKGELGSNKFIVANNTSTLIQGDFSTGYVGIGTTNPEAKLEVNGQVKITGGTPGVNKVLTSDAVGLASWSNTSSPRIIRGSLYLDGTIATGTGFTASVPASGLRTITFNTSFPSEPTAIVQGDTYNCTAAAFQVSSSILNVTLRDFNNNATSCRIYFIVVEN